MSALRKLLDEYRSASHTEREKGTYFEELILCYLRNEATYRDLYDKVWSYKDWAAEQGITKQDAGIDLVARTAGTNEFHAIQCKLYDEHYRLQKSDIDSFFTASGKKQFSHRVIVSTTNHWTEHAEDALRDQQPPVSKIDLHDLENSQVDWSKFQAKKPAVLKAKKSLRPHQKSAVEAVLAGLKAADRGKLIMACGTGKTFTSLKIAEEIAGNGKRVLFLVPSLALLSQTLTEWTQESGTPLHSFAVCSDSDVGKKRSKDDDTVQTFTHELRYPATTDAKRLAAEMMKRHDAKHMSVVFGTYQSIDVVSAAQKKHDLPGFDLIICDEAHRTTGAKFEGDEESHFVRVHDAKYLVGKKRLYMTATPRIYGELAKATAERDNVALYGMDDVEQYGNELYVITFSDAVKRDLLVDYKVIVLAVEEAHINRRLQNLLKDENNQLKVDDAAKIIGCWKALSKQGLAESLAGDDAPMHRAVAFCQVIEVQKASKVHKVSSKNIAGMFQAVVEAYQESAEEDGLPQLACEAEHVDGGMNASEKESKLSWLKADPPPQTCRVLSNVRCLAEGVDVPALDAVLFLAPRNSQVEVVQSVGRVMRKAEGKKLGYVVLPVVIPPGIEPHEALNDNQTYKVVWQVLQALRSHDDRFDAMVNKLDLVGKDVKKMEVIAITDKIKRKVDGTKSTKADAGAKNQFVIGEASPKRYSKEDQHQLQFEIGEIERAIYAKLVQKVGNRRHWEEWANDIAKIAKTHIDRITALIENPRNAREREAFSEFAAEIRDDLNDSISDGEIIEMLAQHLITKPVFDALFDQYSFANDNPISRAMQNVLAVLQKQHLEKETDTLQAFYASVKLRAEGIEDAAGKQKIVVELYDKFFRNAFPKMSDRLGIVYTPVEIVDFIVHSVADLLRAEFQLTLGSRGVHVLDPFAGTGTFITRILQSKLIEPTELPWKYKNELHANEIVLLAYYIAAINIEAVYHGLVGGKYLPFEGICLTDTFQMYEKEDLVDALLVDNSKRRRRQRHLDIRVIVGNPPYSEGQRSENDNNQNLEYRDLDRRIRETYGASSKAGLAKGLYNSYVRAIRWASDRIGNRGIVAFVSGAGYLETNTADGLRKCLAEEFNSIFVYHLRGNANSSGELRRKEKGNVFGAATRAPIAISFFVKNPESSKRGEIYFHDVGDYLSREEKLAKIEEVGSVDGITAARAWRRITPDAHGDWFRQRDDSFESLFPLVDKSGGGVAIFRDTSFGVVTNRDAWCCNFSRTTVEKNMRGMISFYNKQVAEFAATFAKLDRKEREAKIEAFIDTDRSKISWTRGLKHELSRGKTFEFESRGMVKALYRPFTKVWLYFNPRFNEMPSKMARLFPSPEAENRVICVSGAGSISGFTALMSDVPVELCVATMKGGSQCFPLYWFEDDEPAEETAQTALFGGIDRKLQVKSGLTDRALAEFQRMFPHERILSADVFYYTYAVLHSSQYRKRYADNLAKALPRIPIVKLAETFWALRKAGAELAELHVGYEKHPPYSAAKVDYGSKGQSKASFHVNGMRFGKSGKEIDRTIVNYNDDITVSGIPLETYEYMVNGRSAVEWVMDRQRIKTDVPSGIVTDANDWARETMLDPRYPLDLLLRVVSVSLETLRIVRGLPDLEFGDSTRGM